MTVFSTIVVGTDGSPDAEQALRTAAGLTKLDPDAELHVVAAFHPIPYEQLQAIAASVPDEFKPQVHAAMNVESTVASARSMMTAAGVDAEYHEVKGNPTESILDVAESHDADLIVVGSRGEGMVKRLLHGSISTNVFHHAPCTVMVVRNGE